MSEQFGIMLPPDTFEAIAQRAADILAERAAATAPATVLLTKIEVAEQLRVDPRTVERMVDRGDLVAYRVGERSVRFRQEDVDELRKPRPPRAPSAPPTAAPSRRRDPVFRRLRQARTVRAVSVERIGSGRDVRWRVRWREGGRGSRQRQQTFDRQGDAERFQVAIRRQQQLGGLAAELVGSEQTVAQFIEEWWSKYATVMLKRGTQLSYAHVLDKWLLPYLGRLRLRDLSRESIDTYRSGMVAAGAGVPTVNRSVSILQGILSRAVEWRRIPANPAAGVRRLPHHRDEWIDARTVEEVETIRDQLGPRDAALVAVLAYEGLRPSEAFALEWRDVVDRQGHVRERLRVERALSGGEVSSTKSSRSREPELFAPVRQDIRELYLASGRPGERELVFPKRGGGCMRLHTWRRSIWTSALEASGIAYFRPYDLRHTCATLLVYEGRNVNEVSEHLGHADPGFTLRVYGHVWPDARARGRRVTIEEAIACARAAHAQPALG